MGRRVKHPAAYCFKNVWIVLVSVGPKCYFHGHVSRYRFFSLRLSHSPSSFSVCQGSQYPCLFHFVSRPSFHVFLSVNALLETDYD